MLRFLAIPLMIMSAMPNNAPCSGKPVDPVTQHVVEADQEACPYLCPEFSVFHGGAVARFGLNKTALRPQGDKKYRTDFKSLVYETERQKEVSITIQSKKAAKSMAEPSDDLVSPLTINLFF